MTEPVWVLDARRDGGYLRDTVAALSRRGKTGGTPTGRVSDRGNVMRRRLAVGALFATMAVTLTACPPTTGGGGGPSGYTLLYPVDSETARPLGISTRSMSADGRYVVWNAYDENAASGSAKLFDRTTGLTTTIASFGRYGGPLGDPFISADGSTVYFEAETGTPPVPPVTKYYALYRYTTATGDLDHFDLPIDPTYGYSASMQHGTTNGDGSVVVFGDGSPIDTQRWTEATGFVKLPPPIAGCSLMLMPWNALSRSGRYVAEMDRCGHEDTDGFENGFPVEVAITVRDLQTNTIRTSWKSGVRTQYPWPSPEPFDLRIGATLDDGSVLFTYTGSSVFRLDGATGAVSLYAGYADVGLQGASWNGRFVSYTGPGSILPFQSNVNELADHTTGVVTRMSGNSEPGRTAAKAISDDGRYVLLFSTEGDRAPSGPGVYLWDRGAP
jgi:hypothetical protein